MSKDLAVDQRHPRRLSLWSAAFAAILSIFHANGAAAEDRPPNIVFIAIDDLRTAVGAYGDEIAVTPNMDAFAQNSTVFDRAYVQMATCSPSRASLMSSLRPDALQIYYSSGRTREVQDSVPVDRTMNGFFKANGYETIGIGKIYHVPTDSEKGWSAKVFDHQADESFKRRTLALESESYLAALDSRKPGSSRISRYFYEAADVGDAAYPDGLNTLFAVQELSRLSRNKDKPFFLALGLYKPHLPWNAPKKYYDLYDPETMPLPAFTTAPKNAHAWTMSGYGEMRGYSGFPSAPGAEVPIETLRKVRHAYYANVSYADAMVGKVVAALAELGLDDNTIVVLWGDHGFKIGDYGSYSKHTNFEIDTRVPLMVRMPGNKTASRTSGLVETIDIFPTLATLAGLDAPDKIHGTSFATLLEQPDQNFREATFQQFYRSVRGEEAMGYTVRSKDFRYIAWTKVLTGEVFATELYDHRTDPGETVNIADDPAMAAIIAQHEQIRLRQDHGVGGREFTPN